MNQREPVGRVEHEALARGSAGEARAYALDEPILVRRLLRGREPIESGDAKEGDAGVDGWRTGDHVRHSNGR